MKTLLIALLLPFTMFFSEQPGTTTTDPDPPAAEYFDAFKKVEVDVEVDLGRKKKGCSGFGVCGVVVSTGVIDVIDGSGGMGKLTIEDGQATNIFIHRASLNTETLQTYFSKNVFTVNEPFKTTLRKGGNSFIIIFPKGNYQMQKTPRGFNIGMPPT